MSSYINNLYELVKETLFAGVDAKYHDLMEKSYKEYLDKILASVAINDENADRIIPILAKKEIQKLNDSSVNFKLMRFVSDENYNKISILSNQAYDYALQQYKNNSSISIDIVNNNINEMEKCFENVFDFNKESAKNLLSEAVLDYQYASGKTDDISFRLSNVIDELTSTKKI